MVDQSESLHKEINYYKGCIDELAGDILKLDNRITGLKHEIIQKRQGFALLAKLQHEIQTRNDISEIYEHTVRAINAVLGMDKTVALIPTDSVNCFRPGHWMGFTQDESAQFDSLTITFPGSFLDGSGFLCVNKATKSSPLIEKIKNEFNLPYFICVPVIGENTSVGLIITGRRVESLPFFPPLDQGDIDTLRAIGDLITATLWNWRLGVYQELDRLKTEFYANISHEFRTPITLTLGPLDQLLKGRFGEIQKDIRNQLQLIQRNQTRLLLLVNQILDLTKLDAGQLRLKVSSGQKINHFIKDRIKSFQTIAEKRGIELKTNFSEQVNRSDLYIDYEQFDKVISNLLSNAYKFTKKGHVEVSTGIQDNQFYFIVSDTGVGIKEDQLPLIFDRYRQADGSESREYAGTGIGLALVKDITELHGGKVTVHSQYQKGSAFQVCIPLGKSHLDPDSIVEGKKGTAGRKDAAQVTISVQEDADDAKDADKYNKEMETVHDPSRPTILYVEDNGDLRTHVRQLLENTTNIYLAVDGEDGLVKTKKYNPDLILTDQMMPRMGGRALLRHLRKDANLKETPVIFLTARAGKEARIESLDAGANDYIAKPFDEEELFIRIRNVLKAQSHQRELAELNQQLEVKLENQLAEMGLAAKIQRDLLPEKAPDIKGYDIAGKNIPAKMVGGDYFDFIELDNDRTALVLGDVCGKGLPASLVMANLQATIRGQAHFSLSTAGCLSRSNKLIYESTDKKTFASLFYSVLDKKEHVLYYANAGQNWPLIFSESKPPRPLKKRGLVLGAISQTDYQEEDVAIKQGDLLLIFSDGVVEAMNHTREEFGEKRLQEIVTLYRESPADVVIERILSAIHLFTENGSQNDDITIIAVRRVI